MSAASGRFRPVDYSDEFVARIKQEFANDPFILDLLQRKSYSLGAYLDDRSTNQARIQLHSDWRKIVDSRPLSM